MDRITRSIALAGMVGSLALVARDDSNAPRSGTVTLRGNVQSQAEKDAIAAKAAAVVGSGRVVNHLVVDP